MSEPLVAPQTPEQQAVARLDATATELFNTLPLDTSWRAEFFGRNAPEGSTIEVVTAPTRDSESLIRTTHADGTVSYDHCITLYRDGELYTKWATGGSTVTRQRTGEGATEPSALSADEIDEFEQSLAITFRQPETLQQPEASRSLRSRLAKLAIFFSSLRRPARK